MKIDISLCTATDHKQYSGSIALPKILTTGMMEDQWLKVGSFHFEGEAEQCLWWLQGTPDGKELLLGNALIIELYRYESSYVFLNVAILLSCLFYFIIFLKLVLSDSILAIDSARIRVLSSAFSSTVSSAIPAKDAQCLSFVVTRVCIVHL